MFETQITIVGLGDRIRGTNAKGEYDLVNMAFTFPDKRMVGVNAACIMMPGKITDHVVVGDTVNALMIYSKQDLPNGKYKTVLCRVVLL